MSVELVIGNERISIEKTFMSERDGIHLPTATFLELVSKHNLLATETPRKCDTYPFQYSASLNGTDIYIISPNIIHFD